MDLRERVVKEFTLKFGSPPDFVVRAPGRVNLIGEHTDYNDGFVLPMAIDRAAWMALRPRQDHTVSYTSLSPSEETLTFHLDKIEHGGLAWGEYIKGMARVLMDHGLELKGWEGVGMGNVPLGAGLSSSAAFEMVTARAFGCVSNFAWDAPQMALLGQKAENKWVGVNCGIMDQMISATGRAGHAVLIDCRSLALTPVPLPKGTAVVILDTATRRGLVDSAYNERRSQCETAARFFGVKALRDVSVADFEARADALDPMSRKRSHHVVTENERTLKAAEVMKQGDAVALGELMNASGDSLRTDFEVTNQELDVMVACARAIDACYGARMTGAGFGGCAVALVKATQADEFVERIAHDYHARTQLKPNIYVCQAAEGASVA